MIVSKIENNYGMSALHLSRATVIFVVECCQFCPNWMFGPKIEIMASSDLVGGTPEKGCILSDFI